MAEPEGCNVLLVAGSLEGGGAERQLSDMANYWAERAVRVTLATWTGPEVRDFYPLHGTVRRAFLNVERARRFRAIRENLRRVHKLRQLVSATRPDVILSFLTESNVLVILATAGVPVRVVVSERIHPALHGTLPFVWRALRWALYAWSGGLVAQTHDAARWLEKHCRRQVAVIPNALRPLPEVSVPREHLILAVGRLDNQKGFDLLLRAFALIAADFSDWRLTIVGKGGERDTLLRLSNELHLTHCVELVGEVRDVEAWMARAGLIVQPSRFEGFPNVVLEGMGMGAAVISADCHSGPSDIIEDGVSGRLVPVGDVAALAAAMAQLMAHPQMRERLGAAARNVRQRFRQDVVMRQWESVLSLDQRQACVD